MVAISKNNEIAAMALPLKRGGLQWKLNTAKLGLFFNLKMLLAILDGNHYQKSQNGCHGSTAKIVTCSENWTLLNFGQSLIWICCWPSKMAAIIKNYKMATMAPPLKIETCNSNQKPLHLGQSSTRTCCWPYWKLVITKYHKNGCHGSTIKDRDLQQKPNTIKFRSIFNLLSCCWPS